VELYLNSICLRGVEQKKFTVRRRKQNPIPHKIKINKKINAKLVTCISAKIE
jgi:hypothetical protein